MIVHRASFPANLEGCTPLEYLFGFCEHHELHVTSGERILPDGSEVLSHTGHVHNSLHYIGHAVDCSVHLLSDEAFDHIVSQANELGINVIDERHRPEGGEPWSGPHGHFSVSPAGTRLV